MIPSPKLAGFAVPCSELEIIACLDTGLPQTGIVSGAGLPTLVQALWKLRHASEILRSNRFLQLLLDSSII
jgi:hypothetical protein